VTYASWLCSALLLAGSLLPQQPEAPPEPAGSTIRSNVREVLLDVVVRQKNHELARKLKAQDFTITEDGVPQKIKTFRLVTGKDTDPVPLPTQETMPARVARGLSPPPPVANLQKVEEPAYISIIFEELTPDSRKYARDAALEFLKHELRSNTYVAIFSLNGLLYRLQDFSTDRNLLARAVEHAALSNYSSLTAGHSRMENAIDYQAMMTNGTISITSEADPAKTPDMATGDASTVLGDTAAKVQSQQREVAMYMSGMRTVDALLNLVKYEAKLPGRKTILYVCEGLNLPPGQRERMFEVISSANRANVSFYGVDARGLLLSSPNALARSLNLSIAETSARRQLQRTSQADEAEIKQEDSQMEMGVANTQLNLQELSQRTGGFAIMDTNEIGKQMIRVMEDVRTHYEITYTPVSTIYDGRFRKIAIATTNPKLDVQSRDGYYALPDLNGHSLDLFEMRALDALSSKAPSAFPLHLAALRFDPFQNSVRYEIAFDLAAENVTTKVEPATHQARIHASFLALIKDSQGSVVDKVSRDIDLLVPTAKVDLFRKGNIIFTVPVLLAPGHYTVEGVALDAEGKRSGIRRMALSAPRPDAVSISDVALVHDFQPLTAPRDATDPLQFAGGRVTPQLDSKIPATEGASLYFVLYPGGGAKPEVTVDFFKDGSAIAETHPQLAASDDLNSIPVVASAKLPPGDYQARVTVQESGRALSKWTAFTVAP
jgi:VWFA-related protein